MMTESVFCRVGAILAVAPLTFFTLEAHAAEPEDADLVDQVSVNIRSHGPDEDGNPLVGRSECQRMLDNDGGVTFTWTLADGAEQVVADEVAVFAVERGFGGKTNCDNDDCTLLSVDDLSTPTEDTITLSIDFADFLERAGGHTTCEGFDQEFFARITVPDVVGGEGRQNSDAKVVIDTVRPTAPSGLSASASENTIEVEFTGSPDGDVDRYVVYYSKTAFDGGQQPPEGLFQAGVGQDTEGSIDADLEGASSAFVAVGAEDETGNVSDLSGVVEVAVIETADFWEAYKAAGGSETGGCSTTRTPGAIWPALLVFGLVMGFRRRRRRTLAAAVLALALLTPAIASADSPTMGAFELKLGGYYPAIDDEFDGTGPFESIFGAKNLLVGELEVDVWLWQRFGKLGVGGHIGFSRVKGTALAADPGAEVTEETRFSIVPLRVSLVYRFDWLAQNTKIPVSVGLKGGLDWYRWRIGEADGDVAEFEGETGAGWKSGWHLAAGIQLLLDSIHPSAAAAFDLNWGINNSYFFVEYMTTKVDDFGGEGFDLSDDIWMLGLSFEF